MQYIVYIVCITILVVNIILYRREEKYFISKGERFLNGGIIYQVNQIVLKAEEIGRRYRISRCSFLLHISIFLTSMTSCTPSALDTSQKVYNASLPLRSMVYIHLLVRIDVALLYNTPFLMISRIVSLRSIAFRQIRMSKQKLHHVR